MNKSNYTFKNALIEAIGEKKYNEAEEACKNMTREETLELMERVSIKLKDMEFGELVFHNEINSKGGT